MLALAGAGVLLVGPGAAGASAGTPSHGDATRASGKQVDVVLRLEPRRSGVQRLARAVSDPSSPSYGEYLDPPAIGKRFGARQATRRQVRAFLSRRGVRARVDVTGSFAHALVPARTARPLFGSGKRKHGRIPRGLRGAVRVVLQEELAASEERSREDASADPAAPRQGQLAPPFARTGTPAGCEDGRDATFQPDDNAPLAGPAFTPNQIQTAYRAAPLHERGVTGEGVRAAILGAGGLGRRELRGFTECFGIEMPPARLIKVDTRSAGQTSDETALDLQMLTLMAPGLESISNYAVGSGFWPVDFAAMIDPRNAPDGELPHLISVSQGDCEDQLGRAEVDLSERVLAAAAAAGITVAAGAGDAGSFCGGSRVGFYPGSSRWATSVGGTALTLTDANAIADEVVWNDSPLGLQGAGGGGSSGYLGPPFYQSGLGISNRRGYPDVSVAADGYPSIAIYCALTPQGVCGKDPGENPFRALGNGTSAATPLFVGAIALANQARLQAGAPPIGFANPLLYALGREGGAGALRDVVEGSNALVFDCCQAAPGFDLASGWGSPNAIGLAAAGALGSP